MTAQPRRRNDEVPGIPVAPVVPPVPGALGLPAAAAGKPARRRTGRVARTLRTRWWPRFLLAGTLTVVVGATLSGAAEAWVVLAGALVLLFVGFSLLSMSAADYKREPPMPPGAPGAGQ
jgi:hypothetical protein